MKYRQIMLLTIVLALAGTAGADYAFQGGDAATINVADSILDIVFISDTSGSMYDDMDSISASITAALEDMDCPLGDIYVRANLLGIGGTRGSFTPTVAGYLNALYDPNPTLIQNHSEDNGPAATDVINYYDWESSPGTTFAGQNYFKAVVSIGDEGVEDGWETGPSGETYQINSLDHQAGVAANQAAIANDVFLFMWQGTPWPSYGGSGTQIEAIYTAMATGGSMTYNGTTYVYGATGGTYIYAPADGEVGAQLESLFCTAGSGGVDPVVPVPGAFLLGGLGLAVSSWKLRRRKEFLS